MPIKRGSSLQGDKRCDKKDAARVARPPKMWRGAGAAHLLHQGKTIDEVPFSASDRVQFDQDDL